MTAPGDSPLLSVLIPTLAHREERFLRLLGILLPQAEASSAEIEVVALQNNGAEPIADYRDRLLRTARGKYLCFVDDDDLVAPCYVEKITEALATDPDCVGFKQACTGVPALLSELSLRHAGQPWEAVMYEGQPTYLREFNHAMPVRASLAKTATFKGSAFLNTGEDMQYVSRVAPLLRERGCREVFVPFVLYHYLWSYGDTTQSGPATWEYRKKYCDHVRPPVTSPCFRWIT